LDRRFLESGGAKYLDGFSFHAYNCLNGDLFLARRTMTELNELLARYGADKLEKWQTEQGYSLAYTALSARFARALDDARDATSRACRLRSAREVH